ncbi:hypothetical protein H3C61_00850 [Candidatus Gracilibacteria bacterium]|nr:hypothetical protein [Candidatus Gracilibacteria bacterium]
MKERIYKVIFLFLTILLLSGFYYINNNNYLKIKEIQQVMVNHPEFLPKKDIAKYTSFGFSNLRADIYWLETIQYIGGNAVSSEYKKYLYSMIDLITELNPYFEKPYLIGQLLLPTYNDRYENLSKEDQKNNIIQGEKIGLKGISNFCDETKINLIKKEDDLQKIWNDTIYKNPCKTASLPFGQGFLYYFYLKDPKSAANFYKIASANDDGLEGAKIMAAVMNGKAGDREKSIMMFLTLASSINDETGSCKVFSEELQKVSYLTFREQKPLTGEIIKNIDILSKKIFPFDSKNEENILKDNCSNYINKAIRELNLAYIEEGNKKYLKDKKINAKNAKVLFDDGYISYLPTDFQQYDDYGIIYIFNNETGNFDYEMGKYEK